MDKNAIKKYAVWARRELISRVSQRAALYEITDNGFGDAATDSVLGRVMSAEEKHQRQALIAQIREKGYEQVMEEIAYTWFNRFIALRFMEVNGYLPSRVRVFTDDENNFKPQILTEAINMELDGLDMEKVYALKNANDDDALFKYMLIVQCNALSSILPGMFQRISDYTELLFPDNLLREGSVIEQMISMIPEEDWKDAVQIIGWLYQYYNSEKKNDVFAALKKNVKITKENIPAATQLFTPDWIVRYMVENSLGRLWLEGHPDVKNQLLPTEEEQSAYAAGNRDPEDTKWHYYLEEAEQEPEVQAQLAEIRKEYAALIPEQLKVIDPCMGSGHILVYMFDVLMQIYESYGYTTREAVSSIVENNLYGLDIDDRAAQLAYFAVMMKARQYDRRFFSRGIQPHVYAIVESNHVDKFAVDYFCNGDMKFTAAMDTIIKELHDAKEYGSILTVTPQDWFALYDRFAEITEDINMFREVALKEVLPLVQVAEALAQKYDVVVTNPPYMGSRKGMNPKLKKFVEKNYPDSKSDLYTCFIEKSLDLAGSDRFIGLVTQQSFMFTDDYKELRAKLIKNNTFTNMVHLGADAFPEINGEVVQTSAFVFFSKAALTKYYAKFVRLVDYACEDKITEFTDKTNHYYSCSEDFAGIKATPFSYWLSEKMRKSFLVGIPFENYGNPKAGITTGENDRFMRAWTEVAFNKIGIGFNSVEDFHASEKLYIPYNKGGKQVRWYGNNDYVLMFDSYYYNVLANQGNHLPSRQYYCQKCITWSDISGRSFAARYCNNGAVFDVKGSCGFPSEDNYWLAIAFLNSKLTPKYIDSLNPTTTTQVGDLKRMPVIEPTQEEKMAIETSAKKCVEISKNIYDSSEISWDFQHHPLLCKVPAIAEAFDQWQTECDNRFNQLKANEEELNRIFIDIYGLQDELTPEVEDKDVTVRKADLGRDIRSFISYAVGCMFGRYSLDVDGLAYAGGEWDASKYASFAADKDNIIPICDDEYFDDDIVGLFVEFVKTVYGENTLDENLKFIADALGGKGQPKDVIRNYFLSDFYSDHCKIYQKRPIYWLFDSGKKNGFKALIYMHRYQPDTIARIRTDYVHEQQARYRTAIADLEQRIANASTGERVKLNRKLARLQAQDTELRNYEEKIHHLADQMISIELDDGVKKNYAIFQDVLAKIK